MVLERIDVRDFRSIGPAGLWMQVGRVTTALVGPNLAGKSNVARAAAAAMDPTVGADLRWDRPWDRPLTFPEVRLTFTGGTQLTVVWDSEDRGWRWDGDPVPGVGTAGCVVLVETADDLTEAVRRNLRSVDLAGADLPGLERRIETVGRQVLPELANVDITHERGLAFTHAQDRHGFPLDRGSGLRAVAGIALVQHLLALDQPVHLVVVEEPESFLHPAAQERIRDLLDDLARTTGVPVLVTSESPFAISRDQDSRVVALARDTSGHTVVVGVAWGNEPQARLLGGLFRDPGLAAILDRSVSLPSDVRGLVIVEGGTDEAYLRLAADGLGRADELRTVAIHAAGGAMAAALEAIVRRAATDLPLLVVLDNDQPGRRAKETLTERFGFTNRQQVTTYGELFDAYPPGTEAEDVFGGDLVTRFVEEQGEHSIRGKHVLYGDVWHFDLTSEAKSAFVGWAREHARSEHLARWGALLDRIRERFA
ncbi:MAG TPA: AAA family ATPase [Nitriliruptorales bacterium]